MTVNTRGISLRLILNGLISVKRIRLSINTVLTARNYIALRLVSRLNLCNPLAIKRHTIKVRHNRNMYILRDRNKRVVRMRQHTNSTSLTTRQRVVYSLRLCWNTRATLKVHNKRRDSVTLTMSMTVINAKVLALMNVLHWRSRTPYMRTHARVRNVSVLQRIRAVSVATISVGSILVLLVLIRPQHAGRRTSILLQRYLRPYIRIRLRVDAARRTVTRAPMITLLTTRHLSNRPVSET